MALESGRGFNAIFIFSTANAGYRFSQVYARRSHRHANIRKALQYAFKIGLIDSNPADRIERSRKERFVGSIYNEKELEHLFEVVKGDPIELGVILAAFYGLRRSEVLGLQWDAIDFEQKTIKHTVTEVCLDGKSTVVEKDRTKTRSSYRMLAGGAF